MGEPREPATNAGRPADPTKKGGLPAAAAAPPPPVDGGLDFAIEEIAPTEQLKEGFTGQER
ncbi:MAG: hypothetical protein JNL90_07995 [Planctomycetes bacterium]|nr:hypothetical protein [Planctomycetota bacterium]